jgi:hypothetical protein
VAVHMSNTKAEVTVIALVTVGFVAVISGAIVLIGWLITLVAGLFGVTLSVLQGAAIWVLLVLAANLVRRVFK